jgi:hypothetical protein
MVVPGTIPNITGNRCIRPAHLPPSVSHEIVLLISRSVASLPV